MDKVSWYLQLTQFRGKTDKESESKCWQLVTLDEEHLYWGFVVLFLQLFCEFEIFFKIKIWGKYLQFIFFILDIEIYVNFFFLITGLLPCVIFRWHWHGHSYYCSPVCNGSIFLWLFSEILLCLVYSNLMWLGVVFFVFILCILLSFFKAWVDFFFIRFENFHYYLFKYVYHSHLSHFLLGPQLLVYETF